MTKDDIISAAFRVWGRELYKTTSLAKLADTLAVSKPALYRHFPDKQALLRAMKTRFYDDYTAAVKPVLDGGRNNSDWRERLLELVEFITGFYTRNLDYFIYCMVGSHYNNNDLLLDMRELEKHGVSFSTFEPAALEHAPSALFLAGVTGFFSTAIFFKRRFGITHQAIAREQLGKALAQSESLPSIEDIRLFSAETAERVRNGLLFNRTIVEALPYEELEQADEGTYDPPDPLLKAIAEAIAETGPWNSSMETVAKRSGLSKSGLYAHFKGKKDMLSRLFMSEFDRIAHCGALRSKKGANREERLYLAMVAIADYLRMRPEIIIALEWVRIQQMELDISVPLALHDFFSGLTVDPSFKGIREHVSQWILLMLVAVLKQYCAIGSGKAAGAFDYRILRRLFRFICLGLRGLE